MRLRNKFMLHFSGLVVVLMTAVMAVVHSRQSQVMIGQARKQAVLIASSVAGSSVNSVLSNDWTDLLQEAQEIATSEDIAYVAVFDRKGRRIAFSTELEMEADAVATDLGHDPATVVDGGKIEMDANGCLIYERPEALAKHRLLEVSAPVVYEELGAEPEKIGAVQLGLSLEPVYRELDSVRERLVLLWGLGLTLGLASSLLLSNRITKPIEGVAAAAVRYAKGELFHRVKLRSRDEISSLADNLNEMAAQIHKHLEEIGELNRNLEAKVEQRTRDLAQRNDELREALSDLKKAQAQLIHSEKMASLGQLVAGVAHEINNPLNFIYNGVGPLKDSLADIKELLAMVDGVGSYSEEDREQIEEFKEDIDYDETVEGLDELVETIREGARRATEIVKDLRSFSRLDEAELKCADLHEGIVGSVNLLGPRFGSRIKVNREFGSVPEFEFRPAHLNQVFMNLLSNAEQAIGESGEITIRTGVEGNLAWVEIEDTGSGIDPEHLEHVFEPFFTTKDVGQGTGLGLSISFGIVESHGGEILVESERGKGTCFTVRLPMQGHEEKTGEEVCSV